MFTDDLAPSDGGAFSRMATRAVANLAQSMKAKIPRLAYQ
jgi:hypothetical protein